MAENVRIYLNDSQKEKIKKKFGEVCDYIEVQRDDLLQILRYQGPQICIDFDEKQEEEIKKQFPELGCDFAVIDKSELPSLVKYMPPPNA
jgi:hypothetical protein